MRRQLVVDLLVFMAVTFAITWSIVGLYIWNAEATTAVLGEMKLGEPAFYAAVYAPSVAAIAITARRYGRAGLASLFGSLVTVRVRWLWLLLCLFGYPLLWLLVYLVDAAIDGTAAQFDFDPWLVALPLLVFSDRILVDPGALGEELGWRGFALPRMIELGDARSASLGLGVVWAVWHLPAFHVASMSQSALAFLPFVTTVVSFSVIMTFLFVHVRGSVLLAGIIPHMLINALPHAGIAPMGWVIWLVAGSILVLGGRHLRGPGRPPVALPQSTLFRPA